MPKAGALETQRLTAAQAKVELGKHTDPVRAKFVQGYFRTGAGEYGAGDRFIGVAVPALRKVAKRFHALPTIEIKKLLASPIHEERLLAVVILAYRAQRADDTAGRELADFYLQNRARVNNWDLVDSSAEYVLGPFIDELEPTLDTLSRSEIVWDRRISILTQMHELRRGKTRRYFRFAKRFLDDEHDLIHKAVGWLLREAGKKDPKGLADFLDAHATRMPRTMLRYAIERLPEPSRKAYLATRRQR